MLYCTFTSNFSSSMDIDSFTKRNTVSTRYWKLQIFCDNSYTIFCEWYKFFTGLLAILNFCVTLNYMRNFSVQLIQDRLDIFCQYIWILWILQLNDPHWHCTLIQTDFFLLQTTLRGPLSLFRKIAKVYDMISIT